MPYTADVVAAGGRWWVVWSEQVSPGGEYAQKDLFQAHTGQVAAAPSSEIRVLAQGTKARVVYQASSAVYIRSQT